MAASLTRICSAILAGLMQFVVVSSAVAQETTTYTYDALGRVTGVAHNGGPEAGAAAIYAYDPAGNRANYQATTDARFSISDVISNEGSPLVFTVSRSGVTNNSVSVNYASSNGSAIAGTNYTVTNGTLTFASGVSTLTISVPTIDDQVTSANLSMSVTLSSPSAGSSINVAGATGTIVNIDGPPTFSIASASANEGAPLTFTVTRSGAPGSAVSVNYGTTNGTAIAGVNYSTTTGTLSFASGITSQTFTVPTIIDNAKTANLTLTATLSSPSSPAVLGTGSATGTVVNTDTPPTLSVAPAWANEYADPLLFTITRSGATGNTVTVNYATANGSAIAGPNYTATSGVLTFGPGVTFQSVAVPTTSDLTYTSNLTMTLILSAPSSPALLGTGSATGTITNTDAQPSLSIASASANEGTPLTFSVVRSGATGNPVSVNYATSNGSATAGTNYTATSGVLTFGAGVTTQTITVPTINDNAVTGSLAMTVALSSPSSPAILGTSQATGSILNTNTGGGPTIPGSYVMVAGPARPAVTGYTDGTVGYGAGGSLTPSSIGGGYMISSVQGAGNRSTEASFSIASTANGAALPNSGWTSITIPGVGTKTRSSATYSVFADSSGRQTAKWVWTTAGAQATSGTVVIQ